MYECIIKKLKQLTSDPLFTQLLEFFGKALWKTKQEKPDQYICKHVDCSSTSKRDNCNC